MTECRDYNHKKKYKKIGKVLMNPAINVHNGARKPNQNESEEKKKRGSLGDTDRKDESGKLSPKKKGSRVWLAVKIVLGLFLLFIVIAASFIYFAGKAVVELAESADNEVVVQRVEQQGDKIVVHVPLQKELGFVIMGQKKCFNSNGMHDEPNFQSSCVNGLCSITVTFDKAIPNEVRLYVEKDNNCELESFKVGDRTEVVNRFVKLEMTPELLSKMGVTSETYHVASKNAKGSSSYQIMGTKKVSLDYGKTTPASDVLLIDEQSKAVIVFD